MDGFGIWIYTRATKPRDKWGYWGFISLAVFLFLACIDSIFGGAQPSVSALYLTAIGASVAILGRSWWADSHRELKQYDATGK